MDTMTITIWYAVNGSGQGMVFASQPERNEKRRVWMGEISSAVLRFFDWLETDCSLELPDITWRDEAVPMEMTMSITDKK